MQRHISFDHDRGFNFMFKAVACFIVFVFVLIIGWWCLVGYSVYRVADKAQTEGGLKPAIESIWCGKPGCLDK